MSLSRRQTLHRVGTSILSATSLVTGCVDKNEKTPSNTATPVSSKPSPITTDSVTVGSSPTAVQERPYTALIPAPHLLPDNRAYRVIATKPWRARQFEAHLGEAVDSMWKPGSYGELATFGAQTNWGRYIRANIDTSARESDYASRGSAMDNYRTFQRYRISTGVRPAVTAFTDTTQYVATADTEEYLRSFSSELVDLHYGDGQGWQRERDAYATLVEHLPQGILTVVYPTGRDKRYTSEAAFGQTARVSANGDPTASLRTVIVYPDFVDDVSARIEKRLDQSSITLFPIRDPTVERTGQVAVIEDQAPAEEITWV